MKAMILAAGRGERMRPLTDTTPKPLLKVNDQALIEYHIKKLKAIGITELVVNHAWLGGVIEKTLGDGSSYGVHILYSPEIAGGLETAGGIRHALHLLGTEPFIVVNGDVYTDFDYSQLLSDYLCNGKDYTFSGISVYRPEAFRDMPDERAKLKPYFDSWIRGKQLLARKLNAFWCDVGTPERLADLDKKLRNI